MFKVTWVWHTCHTEDAWTWHSVKSKITCMPDPRHVDIAVSQVQDGWMWQCGKSKVTWVSQTCQTQDAWTSQSAKSTVTWVWQSAKSKVMVVLQTYQIGIWTWLRLDVVVRQVQGDVGLATMPDPRRVVLAVLQVQSDVDLTNMSDPRHLDLVVSQVQGNNHPPLACPGE
jgi:hypothetical protein